MQEYVLCVCSDKKSIIVNFSNEYARPRGPAVLKRHAGTRICHAGDQQSSHVHFFFLAVSSEDSSDVVSIWRMKLKIQTTKLHFAWLY